jgi:hypothetical protein
MEILNFIHTKKFQTFILAPEVWTNYTCGWGPEFKVQTFDGKFSAEADCRPSPLSDLFAPLSAMSR